MGGIMLFRSILEALALCAGYIWFFFYILSRENELLETLTLLLLIPQTCHTGTFMTLVPPSIHRLYFFFSSQRVQRVSCSE